MRVEWHERNEIRTEHGQLLTDREWRVLRARMRAEMYVPITDKMWAEFRLMAENMPESLRKREDSDG
jgi:hypothetical protein